MLKARTLIFEELVMLELTEIPGKLNMLLWTHAGGRYGEHAVIPNAAGSLALRARDGSSKLLRGHRGLITHVEFTRDGRALLSSSSDGTLRRWDVESGTGAEKDGAFHQGGGAARRLSR